MLLHCTSLTSLQVHLTAPPSPPPPAARSAVLIESATPAFGLVGLVAFMCSSITEAGRVVGTELLLGPTGRYNTAEALVFIGVPTSAVLLAASAVSGRCAVCARPHVLPKWVPAGGAALCRGSTWGPLSPPCHSHVPLSALHDPVHAGVGGGEHPGAAGGGTAAQQPVPVPLGLGAVLPGGWTPWVHLHKRGGERGKE